MAYLIFNNSNDLVKIAANDSDRDSLNLILTQHSVVSVSDSDFLKVRTGASFASYDGTNATITEAENYFNEESLKKYFENVVSLLNSFLSENMDNSLYDDMNNYKNYLLSFDTSSVTLPLNKSWEEYCNENSIVFYHPLQIP
jgi:hypothetical protein|tara:strand:- start:92 stop:517 length:426 start_codon:yes stop_codon:yes gene_type:complete